MKKTMDNARLSLSIGIALTTGMFTMLPVVAAAPVQDTSSSAKNIGNVTINNGTQSIDKVNYKTTDITSTDKNNVISWKDFSVAQDEAVRFDKGQKTNNYLNVVTGEATSFINGKIVGGNNVYIVNPNGVIFGETASVNVGNLYVSTQKGIDSVISTAAGASGATADSVYTAGTAAFGNTTSYTPTADIVNLGGIQADKVTVVGKNVRFSNASNIINAEGTAALSDVSITTGTNGYAHIGYTDSAVTSSTKGYTVNGKAATSQENDFKLITTADELNTINTIGLSLNYMLGKDIVYDTTSSSNFTPIGSTTNHFKGNFDGMFFSISGLEKTYTSDHMGIFGYTEGSKIWNLGLVNSKLTGSSDGAYYVGGIVGDATNTTLTNVYVENSSINGGYDNTGSLVGQAQNTIISVAYSDKGTKSTGDSLIAGGSNFTVTNVYNQNGSVAVDASGADTFSNVYISATSIDGGHGEYKKGKDGIKTNVTSGTTTFSSAEESIFNDNETWLHESNQYPILKVFLKGTVAINYNYVHNFTASDGKSYNDAGSNKADDISLTYNHGSVNLVSQDGTSNLSTSTTGSALAPYVTFSGVSDSTEVSSILANQSVGYVSGITDVAGTADNPTAQKLFTSTTTQRGYLITGNEVTITPRHVTITNPDASSITGISKTYDGTTDAPSDLVTKIVDLVAGGSGSTGLISDDDDLLDSSNVNAAYEDKNVGQDKKINVTGGLSLKTTNNYKLDNNEELNTTLKGDITKAKLVVALTDDTSISKEYDGDYYVYTADKTLATNTADKYSLSGVLKKYNDDGTQSDENEDVSLAIASGSSSITDSKGNTTSVSNSTELFGTLTTDADGNQTFVADKNVSSDKAVAFRGLYLTGDDADNYELVYTDKNNTEHVLYNKSTNGIGDDTGIVNGQTVGGTLYTTGNRITPIALTDYGYLWYDDSNTEQKATRAYTGSSSYTAAKGHKVKNSQIKNITDDITLTVQAADFITADGANKVSNATTTANATTASSNPAKGVKYTITISGKDAGNYSIGDGDAIQTDDTEYTVYGTGSITPLALNFVQGSTKASKNYDGDATVKLDGKTSMDLSSGLVAYASGSNQILDSDKGSVNIVVTGTYQDTNGEGAANVNYSDNAVKDKNVNYNVSISGGNGNYTIGSYSDGSDVVESTMVAGTGVINQAELTGLTFAKMTKVFDNTDSLTHSATDSPALTDATGLVNNETINSVFDTTTMASELVGTYGKKTTTGFTASSHVADVDSVQYSTSDVAGYMNNHNYKLADSLGDKVYGEGAITPLTIDPDQLTLTHKEITKTYDGSTAVANGNHTASSYLDRLYYDLGNNNKLEFTYDVGNTASDAYYATKNSLGSTKQDVTFNLTGISSASSSDYGLSSGTTALTRTFTASGVITPKTVVAAVTGTVDKTYDATKDVKDAAGNVITDGTKLVSLDGLLNDDKSYYKVEAAYDDKNANMDKDGNLLTNASGAKTVNYKLGFNDSTVAGNYNIVDSTGKTCSSITGAGNIKQAPLALTISKATKTYDKDNYVTPTAKLTYASLSGDDVVIGYQTKADSNGKSESATYDDANVGTDKLVTYQLKKSGTDADNYYVTYTSYADKNTPATVNTNASQFTVVNLGDISKKTLTSGDVTATFGQITKVYDTTASVAYDHSDWTYQAGSATAADYLTGDGQGLTVDGVKRTLTTATTGGDYTIAGAVYDSPTVNATKATYTLTLGDWASNYDWSNITNYSNGSNGSNGTLTLTPAATITPKYVVASVKNKTAAGYVSLDKVYNGSAKLVRNSQSDPTGKNLSGNVMLDGIIVLDVSGNVVLDGIIANDAASLDRTNLNSNSAYQSPNVAYDADKNSTAQAVSYAVKLAGSSAGNYVLIDAANADTAALTNGTATGASSLTLTDSGIISPYKLTVTFNDGIDKTYDGKSAVVSQDYETKAADGSTVISFGKAAKGTAAGVNGEMVTLDMTKVTGTYGTSAAPADTSQAASVTYSDGTPGYFTANGDVNYNENINTSDAYNKADYKALGFTGLQEALASSSISGGSGTASAGNYTIADSVYYKEAAQKGRITRLTLQDKDITSKFGTITKEYDGSNKVANPADGFIIYETLTGNNTRLSYNLTSALYDDDWTNVTKGHGVTYTVDGIEQKEFHNFVMPDSVSTRFTGIFQTTGAITPRVIKVTGLNGVTKVYDTSTAVETADRQAGVLYSIDADSAKLLEQAGATLSVTGADYDSKNATIDPGEAATNQRHITYTLRLDGNSAGNFTLDAANIDAASGKGADAQSRTYTDAAGDIERATLTLDSLGRHDKDYDSSSKVTNLTLADLNAAGAFSGLKNNEQLTFSDEALKKIQGDYGTGSSDADFAAQSDVHRDSTTNAVIDYNVRYTGLEKALEAMRSTTDENAIANNYTIANTAYFTEAAKTGRIKPLAITADKVHAEWAGPVSREYNTTSKVYNPSAYLTGLHADFDNNLSTALTYTVTNAVYTDSDNYDKEHSAAGDNLGLRYTVELSPNYKTITSGDDQGNVIVGNNYEMTAATAQALTTVTNAASYSSDMSVTQHANSASITPRIINASLTQSTDLVKVYDGNKWADGQTHADGTTATVDYRDRLVISTEKDATGWSDADVLAADAANGTVNSATTVAYDDRNADIGSSETVKNGKGVTFTLSLSGGGTGNYTLDSTGQTVTSSQDYAATGDIRRRKANVELIQPTDLDKDYDGTTNVYGTLTNPDGTRTAVDYRRNVRLAPATGDTGVIAGDDLSVFADSVSAAYASPDVQRTSGGAVTTQDVVYSNIQFGGADGGNYEVSGLSSDGTLTGTGTIRPRTITVEGINAPTKVYDGTTAVTSDYATAANLNIDRSNVLAGDTVNVALTGTPVYESSDANEYENGKAIGTKGKIGVDYQLVWDNKNYELVRASTADTIDTDATAQSDGTLTKKFVSNTGVITPRTLTLTTSQIEKTYDGTTSVTSPESYVTIGNLVDGQSVADLSRTVNGVFSSADAADSEDVSETARTVTYTVSINNTNYQLDSTGARSTTTTGTGLIHRRGLMVVATPASILAGEQAPEFSGYVENWANDSDAAGQSDFTFATLPTVDPNVWGSYPVYGYYKGQTAGNYGKNYTFAQSPANETAFTVQLVDAGRHYHETINPKGQVTPDRTIYDQASKDFSNSGNRDPEATLAYTMQTSAGMKDVNADLDGKAGYDGNIAITGGDVVNLAGGDALDASMAIVDELPENNGVSGLNIDGQPVSDRSAAEIQNQDDEIKKTDSEAEQTTAAASSGPNSQIGLESEGAGVNLSA